MFRELISAGQSASESRFRSLEAMLKRFGAAFDEPSADEDERRMAESGFYALDDVACVRIRRN